MGNDRNFAIVFGYHPCSYPPPSAYDAGLTKRFAIVFDTYRPDKGYAFFDADLFTGVLKAICNAIPHDALWIEMDAEHDLHSLHELSEWYVTRGDDDRDPPIRVLLFHDSRLTAYSETEEWAMVGGPAPYHDSYTLSFYTKEDRAEEFRRICERFSKESGATITGIHEAPKSKEPFTPLWKIPLKWLGVKPW
jgi:hypothetical protein